METIEQKIQTKIVRDNLEIIILKIINQQPTHGYQIMVKINKTYNIHLNFGIIYKILYNLEQDKQITSTWDTTKRQPRKTFTITPTGQTTLETYQTTLKNLYTTLNNNTI